MAALPQFDYLFAIGTIFAFLDAWNIGANDVANSWASCVSSRSLTYVQAMVAACILEFAGSVGVGGRVADTIRTKVVSIDNFEEAPALLMLGMVCAVVASSLYLTMATKLGMPVSTTHSILGGVLGMGFGALGSGGIVWVGYKDDGSVDIKAGVIQVFLAWIIAPVLSGVAAAIIFLITKYGIMLRSNPTMKGLITIPLYFWLAGSLITMLLLWKGGDYEINLTDAQIPGVIVAAGAGFGMLVGTFLIPYFYRVVIKEDWQLKWYDFIQGPLLLRRGEVPPPPADFRGVVRDFYEGHLNREELDAERARQAALVNGEGDVEAQHQTEKKVASDRAGSDSSINNDTARAAVADINEDAPERSMFGKHIRKNGIIGPRPAGSILAPGVLFWWLKWVLFRGVDIDIHAQQAKEGKLTGDLAEIHARGDHFDNKTEYLYTFLQILTASSASFVHGANDVANAIGPYATIYQVWMSGEITGSKSTVPVWILAFGGFGIALGAWTYGYNIMANLGNKITLMSPSRGFSMELGSVIAVVVATRLELPVSTTQCITGAIVGVGLCNGDWRAINWRMVAWIYSGWVITVPTAALISGCLMGAITYAPNWS
jgi:sodium-dependent phosphate transporter